MRFLKTQLKPSEIALISIILMMLLFIFNFTWKTSSMIRSLNALQVQVETSRTKLTENKILYTRLISRTPSSEDVKKDFMDQYVLVNDRFSSVITGIVNSSKNKNFSLQKISLDEQTKESGYKKLLYSLDIESSFIEIGKFLEKLEDAPLLTEVTSVEIKRIDNEMKRCLAQIRLYSYVRIE